MQVDFILDDAAHQMDVGELFSAELSVVPALGDEVRLLLTGRKHEDDSEPGALYPYCVFMSEEDPPLEVSCVVTRREWVIQPGWVIGHHVWIHVKLVTLRDAEDVLFAFNRYETRHGREEASSKGADIWAGANTSQSPEVGSTDE